MRTSARMNDRDDRSGDAAAAAGEAHAAEDDRRDAEQRVGAGHRRPDPGGRRQREAAECREQAAEHVGEDLGPADRNAAPERGQPVAADRVQRRPRRSSGAAGSR